MLQSTIDQMARFGYKAALFVWRGEGALTFVVANWSDDGFKELGGQLQRLQEYFGGDLDIEVKPRVQLPLVDTERIIVRYTSRWKVPYSSDTFRSRLGVLKRLIEAWHMRTLYAILGPYQTGN